MPVSVLLVVLMGALLHASWNLLVKLRRNTHVATANGACSLGSYAIALWAMTRAPVAAVAAIRETSIVFGMVLGALVLHERVTWIRTLAAIAVTLGVWVMRAG